MVYILETELNKNKSIFFALTKIYGINFNTSVSICKKLGFSKNLKIKNLTNKQIKNIVYLITNSNINLNNNLKKNKNYKNRKFNFYEILQRIKKIKKISCKGTTYKI